jgi:hypothetical protein
MVGPSCCACRSLKSRVASAAKHNVRIRQVIDPAPTVMVGAVEMH